MFVVAATYDHSNSDCFVCAILTHGDQKNNEDILFTSDDYVFNKDVFALFRGDNCHTLAGKPKLFIIQVINNVCKQTLACKQCTFTIR